jgi:starch synthase (maltosyl-transferring)
MTGRLGIDDVSPSVSGGRHPSKAVVGEVVPIGATVWREGHDAVAANVVWKKVGSRGPAHHARMTPTGTGTDRFTAVVVADEPGLWTFRVDAWSDPWSTWRHTVTV